MANDPGRSSEIADIRCLFVKAADNYKEYFCFEK